METAVLDVSCLVMAKPTEVKKAVNFRMPVDLLADLEKFVDRQVPETTPSAVMILALRDWLSRNEPSAPTPRARKPR